MKVPATKQNKRFNAEFGTLNVAGKTQFRQKTSSPGEFNEKRNPLSFVVDWQLPEEYS